MSNIRPCSYLSISAPRGQAVTRFPGTRQEEEKQNKPERAATACGLHWKGGLIISYTGNKTKRDVWAGVPKVSRAIIEQVWVKFVKKCSAAVAAAEG